MADLMDLDASLSAARATVENWRAEFQAQLGGRYTAANARAQLRQLAKAIVGNPGMAAYYKANMPTEYAQMEQMVGAEGQVNDGMGQPGQSEY